MNFDQQKHIENKEYVKESKIDLNFFRHSIKSSDKVSINDYDILLSNEGRKLSKDRAYGDVNMSQSVAFGSDRVRAQETAAFIMAGSSDDITGTESMIELKEKLNKDIAVGSKIGIDSRLNFLDDENTPLGKKIHEAINRGEYLKFIVESSDVIARETGDVSGANYSRKAADIARVVEKYIKISSRWNNLVSDTTSKYEPTLERYLGTHQGMQESFLAKVIEKMDGIKSRDEFIENTSKQGFDFIEGIKAEIITKINKEIALRIIYKNDKFSFEREVPLEILAEIIKEDN